MIAAISMASPGTQAGNHYRTLTIPRHLTTLLCDNSVAKPIPMVVASRSHSFAVAGKSEVYG